MHIKSEFDLYCESQQGCCKEGDDCVACALLWATERASKSMESASTPHNKPSVVICQNIVEDMLNHLVREGLLTRSQCMSIRDTFVGIVVGKLTHVG